MGLLSWLGLGRDTIASSVLAGGRGPLSADTGIASPWSEGTLEKFVYADVFGLETLPVTRKEAMSVPAFAKGRAVILTLLASKPLRELDAAGIAPVQATWLYRTDTAMSPTHRMAKTLDDMIWHGCSLWAVDRGTGTTPKFGPILDAARVAFDQWRVTEKGEIELRQPGTADDWRVAQEGEVIYFEAFQEGLLNIAASTIRGAKSLEDTWIDRAGNPVPVTELHVTDDEMDQDEADTWVSYWRSKRKAKGGAVGMTPHNVELKVHGDTKIELFTEGRNFARLDAAGFLNLNSNALDASLSEASLTYSTQEGQQIELRERLPFWTAPIEARLSMDDVCARGHRIRFDFSEDPTAPQTAGTGPYVED